MKKRVVKSKMIRSDTLQVDCDACGGVGLSSLSQPKNDNGVHIGDEMQCEYCGQVYHWGNNVGVKIILTRGY
mgnify:CR=1 FL=1|jgi:uncharacterized Zn finger protein